MHPQLRLLFLLASNVLIIGAVLSWLTSIFDVLRKKHLPRMYWGLQIAQILMLPQLGLFWPQRPLVRYLPRPFFPFLDSYFLYPYLRIGCILLPAIAAMAPIFVARTVSAYILLAAGICYIALVLIIGVFFNGGAVA